MFSNELRRCSPHPQLLSGKSRAQLATLMMEGPMALDDSPRCWLQGCRTRLGIPQGVTDQKEDKPCLPFSGLGFHSTKHLLVGKNHFLFHSIKVDSDFAHLVLFFL